MYYAGLSLLEFFSIAILKKKKKARKIFFIHERWIYFRIGRHAGSLTINYNLTLHESTEKIINIIDYKNKLFIMWKGKQLLSFQY